MKTKLFFTLVVSLSVFLFGQKKKSSMQSSWLSSCYLPTGEKCSTGQSAGKSIYDLSLHFEEKARTWNAYVENEESIVVFRAFTKTPLFLLLLKNKALSAEKVKEIINSVNDNNSDYHYYWGENNYGHHFGFKSEVQRFIKEGILDRQFVLDTFDNPNDYKETLYGGNKALCYIYDEVGIRIYFINDVAVGYEEF